MNLEKKFDIGLVNVNIEPLLEYKKYINSFFVGVPFISNCRSNYIYTDRLKEFIKRCEDIPVWVTMNSPIVQTHEFSILCDTAIGAYKEFGFHGYTVTNISLLSVLRDHGIPVKVSTVNDIRDLNDVARFYNAGFKKIVLSYKINRNLDFILKCCRDFPEAEFTIIINELCECDCPFRAGHFISTSLYQEPCFTCGIRQPSNSELWRTKVLQNCFVPPENLQAFPDKVIFKLPTRMAGYSIEDITKLLRLYIGLDKYEDILPFFNHHISLDGLDPLPVNKMIFNYWKNCKNQCYSCKICENEVQRISKEKIENG